MTRLHLSLPVADLDRSVAFYTALFGEAPDKVRPGFARFTPALAPLALSLQGGHRPTVDPLGHHHFGVRLTDPTDLAPVALRLEEAGLLARSEEGSTCCFALQDKHWAIDPDGRPWEVYVLLDDDIAVEPAEVAPAAAACCG